MKKAFFLLLLLNLIGNEAFSYTDYDVHTLKCSISGTESTHFTKVSYPNTIDFEMKMSSVKWKKKVAAFELSEDSPLTISKLKKKKKYLYESLSSRKKNPVISLQFNGLSPEETKMLLNDLGSTNTSKIPYYGISFGELKNKKNINIRGLEWTERKLYTGDSFSSTSSDNGLVFHLYLSCEFSYR